MGRDIDWKLCLTAAFVGAVTRKDLAAAFRAVNPATAYDLERAHKWLQGRARPREPAVYDDWARLLDLGRPGAWVAGCDAEKLPTGTVRYEGGVTVSEHAAMHLDLRQPSGGIHLLWCLFPPTPPASVLGGLMCGVTCLDPVLQPSVTRIVAVKLPPPVSLSPQSLDVYLPSGASIAADLEALGVPLDEPDATDHAFAAFLADGEGGGLDQAPADAFRALVDLFDRRWLAHAAIPPAAPDGRAGGVAVFTGRA